MTPDANVPNREGDALERAFARYRPIVGDWSRFLDALSRPLAPAIWTNTLRETPERLASHLAEFGLELEPLSWFPGAFRLPPQSKPGKHWPLLVGLYHIQEEVSMIPVRLLDPRPGERILDLCACPGNKTAQIAVAMENRGTVVANDITWGRMRALRNTIERMGILNVATTRCDGSRFPRRAGSFDRVLVDAPCSCEGTIRKNSGITEELIAGGYRENVGLQVELLKRAFRLCRKGGRVVYSTCTFAPEENELVVGALLEEVGDAAELLPAEIPGLESSPGLTRWEGRELAPALARTLRVWPHQNDTGGFFVAVIEKRRSEGRENATPAEAPSAFFDRWTEPDPDPDALSRAFRYLEERFGIPASTCEHLRKFRGKRDVYYFVSEDHMPPFVPAPDAAGLAFLRTSLRYPRFTLAAALLLGHHARRNRIELPRPLLESYFRRERVPLDARLLETVDGRGYAIVTHRGASCGLGFVRTSPGNSAELESYFPKGWGWGLAP